MTSTAGSQSKQQLRLNIAGSIVAAAGAQVDAIVSYTSPRTATPVTLGQGSLVIANSLPAADASLSVSADVSPCLDDAASAGGTCTVTLTLRLTRDGVLLDESVQTFPVNRNTQAITVPAVNLYEVSTVAIVPGTLFGFEPGDTKTLTATGVNRAGATVAARTVTWDLVSGGVTISAAGVLTAVTPGAARVRATVGGRSAELAFTVSATSAAAITLAPLDTLISIGGTAPIRIRATSTAGDVLNGLTFTATSSNPAVATISANNVVTGVSIGTTTITISSPNGRNGSTVTASTTVRVQAPPPILVNSATLVLDDLVAGTVGSAVSVAVTTTSGNRIAGLQAAVTYTPAVATGWLFAVVDPNVTPSLLTVQASAGTLAPGSYAADVRITSATDPHIPATVHVTMTVLSARRVALSPKTVNLGTFPTSASTAAATTVIVGSLNNVTLSGLAARIEFITPVTGWLTATLSAQTAAPTTTLVLTPRPFGLAEGLYQARVIVSSTTVGAGPDTVAVQMTIATVGRFTGLVLSAQNSQPIVGATATILRSSDNVQVDQVTTGTDGRFTSNAIAAGSYSIVITANGAVSTTIANQQLAGGTTVPVSTLPTVVLAMANAASGIISGAVHDATNDQLVGGATVELRAGVNNTTGTVIATVTTTQNGTYAFALQPPGTYTVRATKATYASSTVNTVVSGGNVVAPVLFISPGTASSLWRFVLSWGLTPLDLDAHLTGPISASTSRFHVFYFSRGSATTSPFATLDVDQTNCCGPETITIAQQFPGIYRYYVNNFSQESPLSTSNARVDVYFGNALVNQFFVPAQPGTIWTVFEISGTVLTPVNTVGIVPPSIRIDGESAPSLSASRSSRAADDLFNLFSPTLLPGKVRR
ncbi:MAG: carboxypeptidase regulatory-like domain-containing protein [Gemmatimonadota bacterium]|nr:carboxypeptidase regulatory-like domain-containing protein [Gemmatimonadota bacterium]